MKKVIICIAAMLVLAFASCGNKNGVKNGYPAENLSDTAKVAFMMEKCEPDSVARYICNTFVGWNEGSTLNSLADAVVYAYNNYKGDKLVKFSTEFDSYANSLPMPQRMLILSKAAVSDADGLGYRLGLEYAAEIQAERKTLKDIDREMYELRKACGTDTITYLRVLKGLSVAMSLPEYRNLPANIRAKYGRPPKMPQHLVDGASEGSEEKIEETTNTEVEENITEDPTVVEITEER